MSFAENAARSVIYHGRDTYMTVLGGTLTYGALKWLGGVPAKQAFKPASQVVSFGARASGRMLTGLLGTKLTTQAGSRSLGRVLGTYGAAAALGYGIGAGYGIGLSYTYFGESGGELAKDIYAPGGVTMGEAIRTMPENAWTIASHYAGELFD